MPKRSFWVRLIILCQIVLLWVGWTASASAFTQEQQLFSEAWRIVSQAYVDDSFNQQNWWLVRQKTLKKPLENRDATYNLSQVLYLMGRALVQADARELAMGWILEALELMIENEEAGRSLLDLYVPRGLRA